MKKKLIYSAAVAALFSASAALAGGPEMVMTAPSPFDGFYFGGNVSFHQTGFDIGNTIDFFEFDTEDTGGIVFTTPLGTLEGGDSSIDAYFGIQGGFGRVFMNRWYAGVEGFAQFGSANGSIVEVLFPGNDDFMINLTTSAHIGAQYGVDGKIGILLSPTTLAYAKLGADWASVRSSIDSVVTLDGADIVPVDGSTSSTQCAFLWGFGVEQFIYGDTLSVFAEYTHAEFGNTTNNQTVVTEQEVEDGFIVEQEGYQVTSTASAKVSAFTGGLNVHFGRNWV